jgi:hypothetical protein
MIKDGSDLMYSLESISKKVPTLNFIKFETKYIEAALDFMVKNLTHSKVKFKVLKLLNTNKI